MAPVDHAGTLLVALVATAVIAQNTTVSNGLQDAVGWVNNPSQRGTLMLLLECLTTIFACTWTVLHLNVPAPTDSTWTRFFRKVKWMLITILFPEFIFAKGVCEFCFALHTLHLMAEMMESHPAWFESREIHTFMKSHKFRVTRRWKAAYGPWMQLLHKWVVLTLWPPNIAENNAEEDNNNDPPARRSSTSSTTRAEFSILQDPHGDAGIPMTERNGRQEYTELQEPQDWTINHAYYANMGGLRARRFTTEDDNVVLGYSVLRGDHLANWYLSEWRQGHPLQELRLSAAEIDDKSKADWLVKLLSMVQISRLILDLINRATIHRPVTQLELGTAAFAVFALTTYLVNWWKPKDVSHSTSLHIVVDESRPDEAIERSAEPFFNRLLSPMLRTLKYRDLASEHYRIRNDELWMEGDFPVVWPLMAVLCVVFGAFHCIAWRWQFPTLIERYLWQVTSVVSTLSPLIPLAFTYFLIRHGTRRLSRHQIEARTETLTQLSPLQRLPKTWLEFLRTDIDDPSWRSIFGDDLYVYEDTRKKIIEYVTRLLELRTLLFNLEDEKNRQANLLENIWNRMLRLKATYESLGEERWQQYKVYVPYFARLRGSPGLQDHEPGVLKTLHDRFLEVSLDKWGHRNQYLRSKDRLESGISRYARYINIFFGIIYAISRVVLVALMFSSLRAAPKGVYEVAGWTRFLPSFS